MQPLGIILELNNNLFTDINKILFTDINILPVGNPVPKTFFSHLYNVGPASKTLGRRCINVIQMFCIYWEVAYTNHCRSKNTHDLNIYFRTISEVLFCYLDCT